MAYKLITPGNSKMGKDVACWSITPVKTCKPTEWCLKGNNGKPRCYALRGRMVFPNVKKSFDRKLKASKRADFVDKMVDEIQRMGKPMCRIHVTGDFYSEEYIDKWIEIARRCPDVIFRTTTRRTDFTAKLYEFNTLPNVRIRESVDPSKPEPVTFLPVAAAGVEFDDGLRPVIHCGDGCVKCGYQCWHSDDHEIFEEH